MQGERLARDQLTVSVHAGLPFFAAVVADAIKANYSSPKLPVAEILPQGGQTNFPRAGGLRQPHDFADCSKGVSVFPRLHVSAPGCFRRRASCHTMPFCRRGRIIIFYSMHPSAEMDEAGRRLQIGNSWS